MSPYETDLAEAEKNYKLDNSEINLDIVNKARSKLDLYKEIQSILKIPKDDYYKLLSTDKNNFDKAKLKTTYQKMVMRHHPDRTKIPESNIVFANVKNAYEVLSDDEKREQYDMAVAYRRNNHTYNYNTRDFSDHFSRMYNGNTQYMSSDFNSIFRRRSIFTDNTFFFDSRYRSSVFNEDQGDDFFENLFNMYQRNSRNTRNRSRSRNRGDVDKEYRELMFRLFLCFVLFLVFLSVF